MSILRSDVNQSDRLFCREQVLAVRPLFRVSCSYIPQEYYDGIMALHALFSVLEDTVSNYTDEAVARARLAWWQQELLGPESTNSQHPITRQLHRAVLINPDSLVNFGALIKCSLDRLEAGPTADTNALKTLCTRIGNSPMRLELRLAGEHGEETADMDALKTANGLVQLIRESNRGPSSGYWWVPLSLLARYGISRSDLNAGCNPGPAKQLIMEICQLGLSWGQTGFQQHDGKKTEINRDVSQRHWRALSVLHLAQLRRLQKLPPYDSERVFSTTRLRDAWIAWSAARAANGRR